MRHGRRKLQKFNAAYKNFPEGLKNYFCGLSNIKERDEAIEKLFKLEGREYVLDKSQAARFEHMVSKTEKIDVEDGLGMVPREVMLQKFVVSGEVTLVM